MDPQKRYPPHVRRLGATTVVAALLLLGGCAVVPQPFSDAELKTVVTEDRNGWLRGMEPVTGPICLDEAIARALKYNLEHRVRLIEQAQAAAQLEAGKFDMLPKLLANAGYHWRNNDNIRNSTDSVTGAPSLANPAISSDRTHETADLGLSWNILDFGLGYYNSKQNADRLLVASERRRKAMHTLIQNVKTTYWRALAAQQLSEQVRTTIDEAERALEDSRRVLQAQVRNPADTLRYQRNLLENLRLLENVDRELSAARIELASLIGLPPGSQFELIEPKRSELNPITVEMGELEAIALGNNADLKEQSYNARIAAKETRKALLRLLPGISFNYSLNYDSDSYLINHQWQQASTTVSFNLFNLLSGPSYMRASKQGKAVAEARRMAVQMAILSQLHLARHQYHDALRQYRRAEAIYEVDSRLSSLARRQEQSQMGTSMERIASNVTTILSSVRLYQAMARVNEASSHIQATLGMEPEFGSLDDMNLEQLRAQVIQGERQLDIGIHNDWGSCQAGAVPADEETASAPAEVEAPQVDVVTLDASLLFGFNKSDLQPEAHAALDQLMAQTLSRDDVAHIEIVGHTDGVGRAAYNLRLSQQRAEAVRNYLTDNGIRKELIGARGMGMEAPVASNKTEEGRQKNRRVEIVIEFAGSAKGQ